MKYVFFIGTEHQFTQVFAAISYFKIDGKDILIFYQNQNNINKNDISNLASKYKFDFLFFQSWTFKDIFFNRSLYIDFIRKCQMILDLDNSIILFSPHYFDDAFYLFLSFVKPFKFFIMDEGNSIFLVNNCRKGINIGLRTKLLIKSFLYRRKLKIPYSINFFTKFDLKIESFDHKFIYIQAKQKLDFISKDDRVVLLGSSVVELDLIEESIYLDFILFVKKFYVNKRIVYFPHRKETQIKLNKIVSMGIDVQFIDVPFSNYLINNPTRFTSICSFFTSSVIQDINDKFENLDFVVIFVFNYKLIKRHRKVYKDLYNYYKFLNSSNLRIVLIK